MNLYSPRFVWSSTNFQAQVFWHSQSTESIYIALQEDLILLNMLSKFFSRKKDGKDGNILISFCIFTML